MRNAELVVEATVLPQTFAIRNSAQGDIETVHTLRVARVLKGNYTDSNIEVHTPGGQLDGIIQSVSHGSSLLAGDSGIYLLRPNDDGGYDLYEGNAGKLTKLKYDDEFGAIHWGELTKYRSWRKLREQIGSNLGVDLTIHALTEAELARLTVNKEFCVKLDNPVPNVEDKTVEFDVMAKSSVPGLKFARAEVLIDYPTGNLGAWAVDQEKIEVEKGDITDGAAYTIDVKDEQEDQIGLSIESPCNNSAAHYVLDTVYEKLATLTVEVNEWGDFGTMDTDDFAVAGSAEYVNPASFGGAPGCTEFEDLCREGEFSFMKCKFDGIILFTDQAAGELHSIGIYGENFGIRDSSTIKIPNADKDISGTKHNIDLKVSDVRNLSITEWDSSYIEVELESNPFRHETNNASPRESYGSGVWEVIPNNNNSLGCSASITIDYSIYNSWISLTSTQRANNYSPEINTDNMTPVALQVYYDTSLKTDLGGQMTDQIFEEIIEKNPCLWTNYLDIEFELSKGIPLDPPQGSIVLNSVPLASDVHGSTRRGLNINAGCRFPDQLLGLLQTEATIRFNINDTWFISDGTFIPQTSYDFSSILLHELGHVFGFSHSMDATDNGTSDSHVMYHRLNSGNIKRNIPNSEVRGIIKYGEFLRTANADCFAGDSLGIKNSTCMSTSISSLASANFNSDQILGFISLEALLGYLQVTDLYIVRITDQLGRHLSSKEGLTNLLNVAVPGKSYFAELSNGDVVFLKL